MKYYFLLKKIFLFVGGSGGIAYWIKVWLNRIRVEIIDHQLTHTNGSTYYKFRIINIGDSITSIKTKIIFCGYSKKHGYTKNQLDVYGSNRTLNPHEEALISAEGRVIKNYPLQNFGLIKISFYKGLSHYVFFFNEINNRVGAIEFFASLILYKLFNKIPE